MDNILVSIITVCYNSEKTIEKTIQSVLNQTYKNIEYIIIDGKSSDHTLDIVHKYEPLFNGRMKIVSEKDNGIYDAMNKGIKLSSGELIGIINSDDFYEINAVEEIVNNKIDEKYQILYGYMNIIKNNVNIQTVLYRHENIPQMMINHPTCFVSKNVYNDFGTYDTKYKSCADYEFMIRQFNNNLVKFVPVNSIIANFSLGGMSSKISSQLECIKMLLDNNLISKKEYNIRKFKYKVKKILKI